MGLNKYKFSIRWGWTIFIVFLIFKLAGVTAIAQWSWIWVTSPLWLPLCFVLIVWLGLAVVQALIMSWQRYFPNGRQLRLQNKRNRKALKNRLHKGYNDHENEFFIETPAVKHKSDLENKIKLLPKPKKWR